MLADNYLLSCTQCCILCRILVITAVCLHVVLVSVWQIWAIIRVSCWQSPFYISMFHPTRNHKKTYTKCPILFLDLEVEPLRYSQIEDGSIGYRSVIKLATATDTNFNGTVFPSCAHTKVGFPTSEQVHTHNFQDNPVRSFSHQVKWINSQISDCGMDSTEVPPAGQRQIMSTNTCFIRHCPNQSEHHATLPNIILCYLLVFIRRVLEQSFMMEFPS
jgi:hypothetical protein